MEWLQTSCWAAEDRPTNKIDINGVRSLSTSELLSIIIGGGTRSGNSVELARRLLAECNNSLSKVASLSVVELTQKAGIGQSTAKKILAAIELGVRRLNEYNENPQINTAIRVYNLMAPELFGLDTEEFWAIYLNNNFELIKKKKISTGGISEVLVDVRIVMKEALLCNATILAVCHNHPSGRLTPSKADDELTLSLNKACQLMRIKFHDHVIFGQNNFYSYHEQGKL